jgi:thymidylate synthase
MNKADFYYTNNLSKILNYGSLDENPRPKYKDGTPAHSKFITQVFEEYDLSVGEFPITTLRNTAIKTGIKEIFWIYQKQTSDLKVARELGINWWEDWNVGDDTIGQRYGATIAKYDLMNKLLEGLKKDPFSRRHIIDMYQYADLEETEGLYPCAFMTLWSVRKVKGEYYLDLTLDQRSNDYIMAGYINKIQYVALQMMVAGHLGYKVGKFCHFVQNLHIYDRHNEAAQEILNNRVDFTEYYVNQDNSIYPNISLKTNKNFYDYTIDDFVVSNIEGIKKLKSNLELAI